MGESILNRLFQRDPSPDEQAMWRVKMNADPEAFSSLMARWRQPIQRLCVRMLGDEHRAEDLTQDTFSRLFAKRADYRMESKFSTYLWTVALNLCRDELRRRSRTHELPACDVSSDEGSSSSEFHPVDNKTPDADLSRRELSDSVQSALSRLSPLYREVVILRHYEALKFREIAEVLGIPEGTVKSRMSEALLQLSRWLSPTGETISPDTPEKHRLLL